VGWNFYNSSGELQINDGGVSAASAVFTGNVDLGSNLLVGNAGSTGIAISANGEVNMAAQPCVLAYNSGTDSNVTGDGTIATVDFDTEVFDQNADFASDAFTAPVTGRYLITAKVYLAGITSAADELDTIISASNRDPQYVVQLTNGLPAGQAVTISIILDMDAADTFTITANVQGESSDVVDIYGDGSGNRTAVSVCLLA